MSQAITIIFSINNKVNSIPVYEEPIDFTNFPLNKAEELIVELPDRWYDKKNNFVFYQMN